METSGEARFIYDLAVRLGKFPGEIVERPVEELRGLYAFLTWQDRQERKR